MPFDEEEDSPSIQSQKVGLKKVSSQKSIFDSMPKKPTQAEFEDKVHAVQERMSNNKKQASDLASQFIKIMTDKTLKENKSPFALDMEKEVLTNMISLAVQINSDPNEQYDGMGSLGWITLLLKTCLSQRDRINRLEYALTLLDKKTSANELSDFINKEINKALDKKKASE